MNKIKDNIITNVGKTIKSLEEENNVAKRSIT